MTFKHGLLYLIKIIVGLILIYMIFLAVITYVFLPNHNVFKKDKFNKVLWLQDIEAGKLNNKLDCQRGRMTQDIIDNVLNNNLSKDDVIKLLGQPNTSSSIDFDYQIGWCSYIDSNSLRIEFDNNHFNKAYIVNH
jgi:hypothetical protein